MLEGESKLHKRPPINNDEYHTQKIKPNKFNCIKEIKKNPHKENSMNGKCEDNEKKQKKTLEAEKIYEKLNSQACKSNTNEQEYQEFCNDQMVFLQKYFKETKKPAYKRDLFLRDRNEILSPLIFIKKSFITKPSKVSSDVIAFEHLLAQVCKLYYKENFSIHEYVMNFMKEQNMDPLSEALNVNDIKKTGRKGRKKKHVFRRPKRNVRTKSLFGSQNLLPKMFWASK